MTRKTWLVALVLAGLLAMQSVQAPSRAADGQGPVDWNRAQQLIDRERRGEKLTADEQAYLDHARQVRRAQQPAGGPTSQPGGRPAATPPPPARDSTGLVPLSDMAAGDKYQGEDGGLYCGGQNEPPKDHRAAALAQIAKVVPRDAAGRPDKAGKIVLLSMGMSNTTQEFSKFKQLADGDPAKSASVVIVDGAQGGQDAVAWNDPGRYERVWGEVGVRLKAAGVTAQQVQVVWLKQALIQPARFGEFPKHAQHLKEQIVGNLNLARDHFPNLRLAYLSSRIYAGYATTGLNPEPYSYESAFAVRWLIADQIKGDKQLNWDERRGEVKSPLLLWGPYLWADGLKGRKLDSLVWKRDDLGPDGTHPSPASGRQKVAELLLKFFTTDPLAQTWFTPAS